MSCVMSVTTFCFVSLSTRYMLCVMLVTAFCFESLSTKYVICVMSLTAFFRIFKFQVHDIFILGAASVLYPSVLCK